jgi:hypothetical protein
VSILQDLPMNPCLRAVCTVGLPKQVARQAGRDGLARVSFCLLQRHLGTVRCPASQNCELGELGILYWGVDRVWYSGEGWDLAHLSCEAHGF